MDGLVDILVKMQCDEHHPPTASHETGESKMAVLVAPGSTMSLATVTIPTDDILIETSSY